jgi:hypothetical protein
MPFLAYKGDKKKKKFSKELTENIKTDKKELSRKQILGSLTL